MNVVDLEIWAREIKKIQNFCGRHMSKKLNNRLRDPALLLTMQDHATCPLTLLTCLYVGGGESQKYQNTHTRITSFME